MRATKIVFIFISVLFLFSRCKNDLNLNAPYKEIPSIYAILNPSERLQMFRINKVFLGEGNAYEMAKVSDSVNYQPGELSVSIKHSDGANITFRDSMVKTVEGAFNTNQRVYVSGEKILTYGTYTLTVKNNHTGNVFTAKCTAIDTVRRNQGYKPLTEPFYPYRPGTLPEHYVDYKASSTNTNVVRFAALTGAERIYQLIIRSHYYNDYGTYTINDYADYTFDGLLYTNAENFFGSKWIVCRFLGSSYFSAVGVEMSKKPVDPSIKGRKMFMIEYLISASTQEYIDYMQYVKPSMSLNQSKPLYSNFDNGAALGIFTMRTTQSAKKEMSTTMISEFASNINTCRYQFYDVNNQLPGCK